MRHMTDSEVTAQAETLKKRQRSEWCELVFKASVGRSMQQMADLLGFDRQWVREHLKRYAVESAAGGGGSLPPAEW
jgi:predicted ArsR family transcriptional regulator